MGGYWSRITAHKREYRILLQGLDSAGKTTVLYKLRLGPIEESVPTIGLGMETLKYKNITFTSWDSGGRCKIRPIKKHFYQQTDAVVYFVDSNSRDMFAEAKDELHDLLGEEELEGCLVMVIANKQDLPRAASPKEVQEAMDLSSVKQKWGIFGTCATNGTGVYEAFDWLSSSLRLRGMGMDIVNPVAETAADVGESAAKASVGLSAFFKKPLGHVMRLVGRA